MRLAIRRSDLSISYLLLLAACLFAPFRFFRINVGISTSVADILLFSAFVAFLCRFYVERRAISIPAPLMISNVVLILGLLITLSAYPEWQNLYVCIKLLIATLFVPLLVSWASIEDNRRAVVLLFVFGLVPALMVVIAALQLRGITFFNFLGGAGPMGLTYGGRLAGAVFHPTWLGSGCALAIPIWIYFLMRKTGLMTSVFSMAILSILIYGLDYSGTRSAVLAFIVSMAFFLWAISGHFSRFGVRLIFYFFVLILTVYATFAFTQTDLSVSADANTGFGRLFFSTGSAELSSHKRYWILQDSWVGIQERPLVGQGIVHYWYPHNSFIGILFGAGMLAALGVLLWVGSVLMMIGRLYLKLGSRGYGGWDNRLLFASLGAVFFAWMVNLMFQPMITETNAYFALGLLFSILYGSSGTKAGQFGGERFASTINRVTGINRVQGKHA